MNRTKSWWNKYGNGLFFISFWLVLFVLFTIIPILASIGLSFTNFDMIQTPKLIGVDNYIRMFLDDEVFFKSLSNTFLFAIITGPAGYLLSFVLAWFINDTSRLTRSFLTFLFYSPTLVGSVYTMWTYVFSGDSYGLINSVLLKLGILTGPIQWLTDANYSFIVVVVVVLWMSMGTGFLSFVAGFKQLNSSYFEAASIDGVRNRWQELWYITLPQMRPQLLIGAISTISGSLAIGAQSALLTGMPSTDYSTHTLVLHVTDSAHTRLDMGYACAVAVVLFLIMIITWKAISKLINVVAPSA